MFLGLFQITAPAVIRRYCASSIPKLLVNPIQMQFNHTHGIPNESVLVSLSVRVSMVCLSLCLRTVNDVENSIFWLLSASSTKSVSFVDENFRIKIAIYKRN